MTSALVDRWRRLRAVVAGHKSAINRHRRELRDAAAELTALEARCRRDGIALVVVPPSSGIGEIHSHAVDSAPRPDIPS